MAEATQPMHDALVAALGLAYEALSGSDEQTEAASATAYEVLEAVKAESGIVPDVQDSADWYVGDPTLAASPYEFGDYLLIRNDKVLAVSANEQFSDGEHPIHPLQSDTIVAVVGAINALDYLSPRPGN